MEESAVLKQGQLYIKRERSSSKVLTKPWQSGYFLLKSRGSSQSLTFEEYKDASLKALRQRYDLDIVKHVGQNTTSRSKRYAFEIISSMPLTLMLACENKHLMSEWINAFSITKETNGSPDKRTARDLPPGSPSLNKDNKDGAIFVSLNEDVQDLNGNSGCLENYEYESYEVNTISTPLAEANNLKGQYGLRVSGLRIYLNAPDSNDDVLSWPLSRLRGYMWDAKRQRITFQTGRKCHFGEGQLQFQSNHCSEVISAIKQAIEHPNAPSEENQKDKFKIPGSPPKVAKSSSGGDSGIDELTKSSPSTQRASPRGRASIPNHVSLGYHGNKRPSDCSSSSLDPDFEDVFVDHSAKHQVPDHATKSKASSHASSDEDAAANYYLQIIPDEDSARDNNLLNVSTNTAKDLLMKLQAEMSDPQKFSDRKYFGKSKSTGHSSMELPSIKQTLRVETDRKSNDPPVVEPVTPPPISPNALSASKSKLEQIIEDSNDDVMSHNLKLMRQRSLSDVPIQSVQPEIPKQRRVTVASRLDPKCVSCANTIERTYSDAAPDCDDERPQISRSASADFLERNRKMSLPARMDEQLLKAPLTIDGDSSVDRMRLAKLSKFVSLHDEMFTPTPLSETRSYGMDSSYNADSYPTPREPHQLQPPPLPPKNNTPSVPPNAPPIPERCPVKLVAEKPYVNTPPPLQPRPSFTSSMDMGYGEAVSSPNQPPIPPPRPVEPVPLSNRRSAPATIPNKVAVTRLNSGSRSNTLGVSRSLGNPFNSHHQVTCTSSLISEDGDRRSMDDIHNAAPIDVINRKTLVRQLSCSDPMIQDGLDVVAEDPTSDAQGQFRRSRLSSASSLSHIPQTTQRHRRRSTSAIGLRRPESCDSVTVDQLMQQDVLFSSVSYMSSEQGVPGALLRKLSLKLFKSSPPRDSV